MLVNVLKSHSIDQSPKKQLLSSESMVTSDEANVLWIDLLVLSYRLRLYTKENVQCLSTAPY